MPRNQETVVCPFGEWTEITNSDVVSITFQALGGDILIKYTSGQTSIDGSDKSGVLYKLGQGEANRKISGLTSLSGANRVYARPYQGGASGGSSVSVYVDHA